MKTKPLVSPPGIFTSPDLYSRRHWRRAQYLADQFWSRWKNEYLQNQKKRSKWNDPRHNLAEGDIVIMEEAHRNKWPLGRVVDAVESSNDGLARKVTIVSWRDGEKKYYLRPISQLVFIMSTQTVARTKLMFYSWARSVMTRDIIIKIMHAYRMAEQAASI